MIFLLFNTDVKPNKFLVINLYFQDQQCLLFEKFKIISSKGHQKKTAYAFNKRTY